MAPTAILANQHYNLAKKIFYGTKINIQLLTGKTEYQIKKKNTLSELKNGEINF